MVRKAGLAIALGATALATTAPADAQRYGGGYRGGYHGGYHRGGIGAGGAAVLGGLVGLGVGAAIASNNRPYYYDRGYGYYGPRSGYANGGYYNGGYSNGGYYAPRCWNSWRWDPYWGRNVRVRVCD
jgi:hypothetical protein